MVTARLSYVISPSSGNTVVLYLRVNKPSYHTATGAINEACMIIFKLTIIMWCKYSNRLSSMVRGTSVHVYVYSSCQSLNSIFVTAISFKETSVSCVCQIHVIHERVKELILCNVQNMYSCNKLV